MSDVPRRFVVVVVGLGNEHYFCCLQQRAHRGMYLLNLYTVVLLVYCTVTPPVGQVKVRVSLFLKTFFINWENLEPNSLQPTGTTPPWQNRDSLSRSSLSFERYLI